MSLGLNILGDRGISVEEIVETASQLKARYHVVMNNPRAAERLQGLNGATVIYRIHAGDDGAHVNYSPQDFVISRSVEAPQGALLYLGNEPAPTQALADWSLEALKVCDTIGRKGVILNFPTGNPEPHDWIKFKPVLQYARDKGHYLGLHEYFDKYWIKDYPYHVGRFLKIGELGLPVPKIVITELGVAVGYKPDRGYRWANSLSDDQYAAQLQTVDEEVYQPLDIHGCLFAYTRDHVGDDWHTFHPRARVIVILSNYLPEEPEMIPIPNKNGERATLTKIPGTYINVREQPNGNDVGDLRIGDTGILYPADAQGEWVYFKRDDNLAGWVSLQAGAVQFTIEAVPDEPVKPSLDEMLNTLVSLVVAQVANIREAYGEADQTFTIIYPVDDPVVTQVYGARPEYYSQFGLPGHEGIDYGGAIGKPIYAAANGKVKAVILDNGSHPYGHHVRIEHLHKQDVFETIYAHLDTIKFLKAGDTVLKGQVIGTLGNTGNTTGPHLHFTLKKNGVIVNPEPYFKKTI